MLGRYAELKAQLPQGTILFYQVGTFFETFEEDAKTISRELSIRLTSREAAGEGRVPLAGVPGHALQEHVAVLLRKGHSVAIAEQRPHPTKPKQFTREISRILTPGTVIEDNVLSAGQANYLAAVQRAGRDGWHRRSSRPRPASSRGPRYWRRTSRPSWNAGRRGRWSSRSGPPRRICRRSGPPSAPRRAGPSSPRPGRRR